MSKDKPDPEVQSIAKNRQARHDYAIIDSWEAGIVLTGTEVKALREGKANISDAYGIVRNGEIYLLNLHISPYERGGYVNHDPTRTRKLLLHRKEIRRLIGAVEREGLTLIPLELYFKKGKAKVALALLRRDGDGRRVARHQGRWRGLRHRRQWRERFQLVVPRRPERRPGEAVAQSRRLSPWSRLLSRSTALVCNCEM